MHQLRKQLTVVLGVLLCLVWANAVLPQDVDALVTPDEVEIEVGQGVQIEVFAFTLGAQRRPIDIDAIEWSVHPDTLGTITEDGFFIAGRHAGVVEIKVKITIRGRTIVKIVIIRIGKRPKPFLDVEIVPPRAVVPVGSEQQFRVVVRRPGGGRVHPRHVRWDVRPQHLGKISEDGLFVAGDETGRGHVIAIVDVDGVTLRARARVVVSPPATGALAGTVTDDADGSAIAGARVRAIRLGRIPWVQRTETDENGNYTLGELIPGFYVVYASAKGFVGEFYDDTRNYLEATPVQVAEEDTVSGIDFGLAEGAKIAGTVVTEGDSLPLARAHVRAFLAVNPRFARHALTDENGEYLIDGLPTGSYFVRANAAGYRGEFFDDAKELADAELLNLVAPELTDGIDFALDQASAISGTVVNEVDGTPIVGARVRVFGFRAVAIHKRAFRETRTDENGHYIVQVPPGRYVASASAEGFNPEFYDDARTLREATLIEVKPDSHTTDIDFDLVPRSSIAGLVTDEDTGEPLAGALVEAFKERALLDVVSRVAVFRTKTDSLGQYVLSNLPAGKYLVRAQARGYLPEFWEESPDKKDATLLEVPENTHLTDIDFTLMRGGSISGFVATERDSTPIPFALVRVFAENSRRFRSAHTDRDGRYVVDGLPSGKYLVQVIAKGFVSEYYDDVHSRRQATPVEVVAPNETSGIDFYLKGRRHQQGTIAGRVFSDDDESSIEGALVVAVPLANRRPHFGFSDADGLYEITGLQPGKYFVFAVARGFVGEFYKDAHSFREADLVRVRQNEVTDGIDFGLEPRESEGVYAIVGSVRAVDSNQPVEGVLVNARIGEDIEVSAVTDEQGRFVLQDLPAGEYKIHATGVGYADAYYGGSSLENAASVTVGNGEDAQGLTLTLETDNVTGVDDGGVESVPQTFELFQNYPNPFNPETTIKYQLSAPAEVTLRIFNLLGQEVATLVDKQQAAGVYAVKWDGKDQFGREVASGIYIFQIKAGDSFKMSRRMLLLK